MTADGNDICSAEFPLTVCKYEAGAAPPISYNVWMGDDVSYTTLLADTVGSFYESACYTAPSNGKIIYKQTATGLELYDDATVTNHDFFTAPLTVNFAGRVVYQDGHGEKEDWTYAICIPKFYSYGRHCITSGDVTELQCNPNGF